MLFLSAILLLAPPLPVPGGPEGALDVFLQQSSAGSGSATEEELSRVLREQEVVCLDGGARSCAVRLLSALLDPRLRSLPRDMLSDNLRFLAAGALADEGALGRAREILTELWEREPASTFRAPALRKLVDLTVRSGQFEQTLSLLMRVRRSLSSDERDEVAYLKGRALSLLGHRKEADASFAAVSRASRHGAAALYQRAILAIEEGKEDAAEDLLCALVRRPVQPGRTVFFLSAGAVQVIEHAWLALGSLRHDRGEHRRAVEAFRVIAEDSPSHAEALYRAAWSLFRLNRFAEARRTLLSLFEHAPRFPRAAMARILLGYTLLGECRFDEAEPIFEEVLRSSQGLLALGNTGQIFTNETLRSQVPPDVDVSAALTEPERIERTLGRLRWIGRELERLASPVPSRVPEHPGDRLTENLQAEASHARHLRQRLGALRARLSALPDDPAATQAIREYLTVLDEADQRLRAADERLRASELSAPLPLGNLPRPELVRYLEAEAAAWRAAGQDGMALWQRSHALSQAAERDYTAEVTQTASAWVRQSSIGRIDSVIGRKQALELEIQNLAVGRYPLSLLRELAEAGLIDETQEYWPYDGEEWPDEIH
ncbi:MAG: tetratricopeptide repeat protein [Myxococcales bacterium]|nr:tetratricopeptide repeat protein [Myxococcales bacterium]